jgi:hypothetical protein
MRGVLLVALGLLACGKASDGDAAPAPAKGEGSAKAEAHVADVNAVEVSGEPNAYTFAVAVASPDTGCDRYANWWEVVSEDGVLLYRRILRHSHVDDQPFTRDGGPIEIAADKRVFVRAHMHPGGYGGVVMVGTAGSGFAVAKDVPSFDASIEKADPQPEGCDR